jgi:hypothetical protein
VGVVSCGIGGLVVGQKCCVLRIFFSRPTVVFEKASNTPLGQEKSGKENKRERGADKAICLSSEA